MEKQKSPAELESEQNSAREKLSSEYGIQGPPPEGQVYFAESMLAGLLLKAAGYPFELKLKPPLFMLGE